MNDRTCPILYIVIPCYNEQEVLPITAPMFLQKLTDLTAAGKISPDSRVLFVNDGSKDRTWEIINELAESGQLTPGRLLACIGFGGGLTWGGAILQYKE